MPKHPPRPSALVVAGAGRYADPWHPFAVTAARAADVLRGAGLEVEVTPGTDDGVEDALAALVDPGAWPDVLVLDVGLPRDGAPSPAPGPALDGLRAFLAGDRALLGVHVAATSFVEVPEWEERLGGRWVRDLTWHPPIGPAQVRVRTGAHPLLSAPGTTALPDVVELVDEVYCDLRVSGDVVVLADAEHEGRAQPLAWVREDARGVRTAYDALGHDERSFDSPGHRALLERLAGWLVPGASPRRS
ncbi:ThuA domain-containing protein [uncultured Pseudokineococcus sp.]|uniref:ThuA domain-containing protein n=1 Tax=uncultured Pseudokineococcus sp. TaxID=1642928 RepID=UPI0026025DA4|nr:ThuA domain-containing protein [uncultured Pseudokineococcus sp.]